MDFYYKQTEKAQGELKARSRVCAETYDDAFQRFCAIFESSEDVEPTKPTPPAEPLHEMAKRLCNTRDCEGCPLDGDRTAKQKLCCIIDDAPDIEEQIETLRKWAAENPPKPAKTYLQDFFEKFPEAPRESNGYPMCCQEYVYKVTWNIGAFNNESVEASWDKPLGYWEA